MQELEYLFKTNNFISTQILSMMTDSDIGQIIIDKISELENEKKILEKEIFGVRGDGRKIMELLSLDRQKDIEKIIKFFQYQLKQRSPFANKEEIHIDELKTKIDIVSLIEILTGEGIENSRRLIKCPLKGHDDSTASFKIYENTDSFYCPGCLRGGDQINFIEYFYGISRKEAIKKFISLTK